MKKNLLKVLFKRIMIYSLACSMILGQSGISALAYDNVHEEYIDADVTVSVDKDTVSENDLSNDVTIENEEVSIVNANAHGTFYGISWVIDDGELTATGTYKYTGDDYFRSEAFPWLEYADSITSAKVDIKGLDETSYMFKGCKNLEKVNLLGLDTSNVEFMDYMFDGCEKLEAIDLSTFNTRYVESAWCMFRNCKSLKKLDLSTFDANRLDGVAYMFDGCESLTELKLCTFNPAAYLYDVSGMFRNCKSLTELDLSCLKRCGAWYYESMFEGCSSLKELDLSYFAAVGGISDEEGTSYKAMFKNCSSLTSLDVSRFCLEGSESLEEMFYGCKNLEEIDVSKWDTKYVESMKGMFAGCSSLKTVDLSGFDTSDVESFESMFEGCTNIDNLDISGIDFSRAQSLKAMFKDCVSLTSLDNITYSSLLSDMSYMFYGCKKLSSMSIVSDYFSKYDDDEWDDLKDFDLRNAEKMFAGCESLKWARVYLLSGIRTLKADSIFSGCKALESVSCGFFADYERKCLFTNAFENCSKLKMISLADFRIEGDFYGAEMFKGCTSLSTIYTFSDYLFDRSTEIKDSISLPNGNWVRNDNLDKVTTLDCGYGLGVAIRLENTECVNADINYVYFNPVDGVFGDGVNNLYGSNRMKYRSVRNNMVYETLPNVSREGYEFVGWFTKKEGGEQIFADTFVNLSGSQTLYAQWKSVSKPSDDNNKEDDKDDSEKPDKPDEPDNPNPDNPNPDNPEDEKPDVNVPKEFVVIFDANEGMNNKAYIYVVNGEKYGKLPVPEREGYNFGGWYTDKNTGKEITEDSIVNLTEKQVLYAHWFEKNIALKGQKQDASLLFNAEGIEGYYIKDSNEKKLASITSKGILSVKKAGTVNVTAYKTIVNDAGKKVKEDLETVSVELVVPKVKQKTVVASSFDKVIDAKEYINDMNIATIGQDNIFWSSSKTSVATIDDDGKITVLKNGKTKIKLSFDRDGKKLNLSFVLKVKVK